MDWSAHDNIWAKRYMRLQDIISAEIGLECYMLAFDTYEKYTCNVKI